MQQAWLLHTRPPTLRAQEVPQRSAPRGPHELRAWATRPAGLERFWSISQQLGPGPPRSQAPEEKLRARAHTWRTPGTPWSARARLASRGNDFEAFYSLLDVNYKITSCQGETEHPAPSLTHCPTCSASALGKGVPQPETVPEVHKQDSLNVTETLTKAILTQPQMQQQTQASGTALISTYKMKNAAKPWTCHGGL